MLKKMIPGAPTGSPTLFWGLTLSVLSVCVLSACGESKCLKSRDFFVCLLLGGFVFFFRVNCQNGEQ